MRIKFIQLIKNLSYILVEKWITSSERITDGSY